MTTTRLLALAVIALGWVFDPADTLAQLVPLGPEFQANTYTTGQQMRPAVGSDALGNFVVVWGSQGSDGTDTSDSSIQGQRYDASGAALGAQFQVNTYTPNFQNYPAVGVDADGDFLVVWWSAGSGGTDTSAESIHGRLFDSTGTPVGSDFQVNTYTTARQLWPNVATDGLGNFVVVWASDGSAGSDTSGYSIQSQRYDAMGAPVGGQVQVNSYTTGSTEVPAVGCDDLGRCAVVWGSEGGVGTDPNFSIQGQRYDALGAPAGGQFQANTVDTTNYQNFPDVAFDGSGNFVVVWQSIIPFVAANVVRGQRFDAVGTPLGAGFQASTGGFPQLQPGPRVAADGDGNVAVVWASQFDTPDADGGIQGRLFDPSDAPLGGQFLVNSYTTGIQWFPAASVDPDGNYVVVWEAAGGTGNDTLATNVAARRFVNPTTSTSSSSTSSTTSTSSTLPTTDLLDGRIVLVRPGSLAKFVAKPTTGDVFAPPFGSPTVSGGALRVFDTGATAGDDTYALPSAGWKGLGNPAGSKGYKYRGAGTAGDPCRVVLVKPRVAKAVCAGAGVTLTPPFAGDVGIALSLGATDRYCARFGGEEARNDATLTKRRNAPPPGACP